MSCCSTLLRSSSDFFAAVAAGDYASGDLVANSTTAGSVVPLKFVIPVGLGRGVEVIGATVQKTGTNVTGATFTLWLFTASPTVTVGDNGAFTSATTTTSGFIGTVAFPAMTSFSSQARATVFVGAQSGGVNIRAAYVGSTNTIYGLLVTGGAYTDETAGETFTVELIYKLYA